MRRLTKLLSLSLALSCLLTTPVFAEDATITSAGSQSVQVTATVGSSFEVTIPKAVTLTSTESGTGTYEASIPVTVKGDIPTNQVITVDTSDTILLTNTANTSTTETADATITKGTTEFDYNTLTGGQTATTSHGVSAELTPGTWSGTASFEITLGEPVIEYTNLLWSWKPSDGYEEVTGATNVVKLSDNFINIDELPESVMVVYTDDNGDTWEIECNEENDGINISDGNIIFQLLVLTNVYDYTTGDMPWATENGMYAYKIYKPSINGTSHNIYDVNIEIYGPAE